METITETTDHLIHHPLFGLGLTIAAFLIGQVVYEKTGKKPFTQPIIIAIIIVITVLQLFSIPYDEYFKTAYPLQLLLGPTVVALAIPLYQNIKRVKNILLPVIGTILIAGTLTVVFAVGIAWVMGASDQTLLSLSTKSITTPIAMIVSDEIGGHAALAAVFVVLTGILGLILGPTILNRMQLEDDGVKGLCLGLLAHAVGTAKALEISEECGAFAALAMGLTGILTAIILPVVIALI